MHYTVADQAKKEMGDNFLGSYRRGGTNFTTVAMKKPMPSIADPAGIATHIQIKDSPFWHQRAGELIIDGKIKAIQP